MSQSQPILFTIDGHANTLFDLRYALAEALLLLNTHGDELINKIKDGAKFTLFDKGYHNTLDLRFNDPSSHANDSTAFLEDDDPHDFDEMRAGHLGDTP